MFISRHDSVWLLILLIVACGLRLDREAVCIAVGLCLGIKVCATHKGLCGLMVLANGFHGMACPVGPGRTARHPALNDVIWQALIRAGFPSSKERVRLLRSDG